MTRFSRWIGGITIALRVAVATPASSQPDTVARTETATFTAGCFWCVEEAFDKVAGVIATTSGFTAGHTANPTYEQVSSGGTGHTEAVQVTYDPARVTYETLLKTFWRNVDAVDAGGQFCDRGSQYRRRAAGARRTNRRAGGPPTTAGRPSARTPPRWAGPPATRASTQSQVRVRAGYVRAPA